jgi:glycosyltransferase involved in cell wall biosynthesis
MMLMRIAWFSPVPPDLSGIAAYSAELAPLLAPSFGAIDLYIKTAWPPIDLDADEAKGVDSVGIARAAATRWCTSSNTAIYSAHEFVWRDRRDPYDLIVYHLGNSTAHDYMWAYLYRYPGLLVLHDAQVHQARALWLLRRLEPRLEDYLAELRAAHPDAPPGLGHLFAAGLGGDLYRLWPMVGLAVRASRMTVVHNARLAERLRREHPGAAIRHVDMGVADPHRRTVPFLDSTQRTVASVRQRLGIPDSAMVVGAFGGITPEKRIPQLLEAVAASSRDDLHVLLVGPRAGHYDVDADARRLGLERRVHIAGYVPDSDLPDCLDAADICWCLRWPSNGETSASWLRCLAAGKPTLMTALAQLRDVPALAVNAAGVAAVSTNVEAVSIAIDLADEPHDITHALDALASDAALRRTLGDNARARWARLHTLARMADDYRAAIGDAVRQPAGEAALPDHLQDHGTATLRHILAEMNVPEPAW